MNVSVLSVFTKMSFSGGKSSSFLCAAIAVSTFDPTDTRGNGLDFVFLQDATKNTVQAIQKGLTFDYHVFKKLIFVCLKINASDE